MKTLCIGYDLNKPGQDYSDLIAKIKTYGTWWHNLDSTWFINTSKPPVQVRDELKKFLDKNDKLLVFYVGSPNGNSWAGTGFSKEDYDWLNKNWIPG